MTNAGKSEMFFWGVLKRDLLLSFRRKSDLVNPLIFFPDGCQSVSAWRQP